MLLELFEQQSCTFHCAWNIASSVARVSINSWNEFYFIQTFIIKVHTLEKKNYQLKETFEHLDLIDNKDGTKYFK